MQSEEPPQKEDVHAKEPYPEVGRTWEKTFPKPVLIFFRTIGITADIVWLVWVGTMIIVGIMGIFIGLRNWL